MPSTVLGSVDIKWNETWLVLQKVLLVHSMMGAWKHRTGHDLRLEGQQEAARKGSREGPPQQRLHHLPCRLKGRKCI